MKWKLLIILFIILSYLITFKQKIFAEEYAEEFGLTVDVKNDEEITQQTFFRKKNVIWDNPVNSDLMVVGFVLQDKYLLSSDVWIVSDDYSVIQSFGYDKAVSETGVDYEGIKKNFPIDKFSKDGKIYYGVKVIFMSKMIYEPDYYDNLNLITGSLPSNIYYTDKNYNFDMMMESFLNNDLKFPVTDYEPDGNGGYKPIDKGLDESIPQIPKTCFTATAFDEITDKDLAYVLMNFSADFDTDYGLYYDVIWHFDTTLFKGVNGIFDKADIDNIMTDTWRDNIILDMVPYFSKSQNKYIYRDISTYDWLCEEIHKEISISGNGYECATCANGMKYGHNHVGFVKNVWVRVAYYDKISKKHGKTTLVKIDFKDGIADNIVITDQDDVTGGDIIPNPPSEDNSGNGNSGTGDLIDNNSFLGTLNNMLSVCQKVFSMFKNILSFLPSWAFSGLIIALPFIVILRVMGR